MLYGSLDGAFVRSQFRFVEFESDIHAMVAHAGAESGKKLSCNMLFSSYCACTHDTPCPRRLRSIIVLAKLLLIAFCDRKFHRLGVVKPVKFSFPKLAKRDRKERRYIICYRLVEARLRDAGEGPCRVSLVGSDGNVYRNIEPEALSL